MISENCSIDEFVETVKNKDDWEVLALALEEANRADRMSLRSKASETPNQNAEKTYSHDLKQLINYMRYSVKPKRPQERAYHLYQTYWGTQSQQAPAIT
jgi:hypothetical protein